MTFKKLLTKKIGDEYVFLLTPVFFFKFVLLSQKKKKTKKKQFGITAGHVSSTFLSLSLACELHEGRVRSDPRSVCPLPYIVDK